MMMGLDYSMIEQELDEHLELLLLQYGTLQMMLSAKKVMKEKILNDWIKCRDEGDDQDSDVQTRRNASKLRWSSLIDEQQATCNRVIEW